MKPTRFFHTSEAQYKRAHVMKFVKDWGQDILIGGDEGWEDDFDEAMDAVVDAGAMMHVYTMGPGMFEWSREERSQIKREASGVGIDTDDKGWKKEWQGGGWLVASMNKIKRYDGLGFYSIEIDNLDSVFSKPEDWINFYSTFELFREAADMDIRLMIKNLDKPTLERLVLDVEEDNMDPDVFAAFAIFEKGTGSPKDQLDMCARIGIQAVTPANGLRDTNNYGTVFSGVPYEVK